jgi:hypothetical protein
MYGTGMDARTLRHFHRVAMNMNNYAMMYEYNYYSAVDSAPMPGYQQPFNSFNINVGLGDSLAESLFAFGMPNSVVNFGYRFGQIFD